MVAKNVNEMIATLIGDKRLVKVSNARLARRGDNGVEEWTAMTAKGKSFPVLVIDGVKPVTLGELPRPRKATKHKAHDVSTKAIRRHESQTFAINKIDSSGPPTFPGAGPLAVEYFSLRCPACLRLGPVWIRFVKEHEARFYSKPLVTPNDKAGLLAFAILRRAQGLGFDTWRRLREMLQSSLVMGADERRLKDLLADLAAISTPRIKTILAAEPTDEDKREAERIQKEAMAVGIRYVPAYFVNGRHVPTADPRTLEKSLEKAAGTK